MHKDLAQEAISAAINADWENAISLNKLIIRDKKDDVEALNRLARAYSETGELEKAKKTAKRVIALDPNNKIALRSLDKWKILKKGEVSNSEKLNTNTFIEEPGKTKIVSLVRSGGPHTISSIDCGDELLLNLHGHRVSVTTHDGKYVGRLPDDIGARIKKYTSMGNVYKILVKSVDREDIKVFIKETYTSEKLKNSPSFPTEKINYIAFTPPELVHNKSDLVIPQDEEDS